MKHVLARHLLRVRLRKRSSLGLRSRGQAADVSPLLTCGGTVRGAIVRERFRNLRKLCSHLLETVDKARVGWDERLGVPPDLLRRGLWLVLLIARHPLRVQQSGDDSLHFGIIADLHWLQPDGKANLLRHERHCARASSMRLSQRAKSVQHRSTSAMLRDRGLERGTWAPREARHELAVVGHTCAHLASQDHCSLGSMGTDYRCTPSLA